jgi:16S rRNA C1402 (ribose-2'-O) methylase RsmI
MLYALFCIALALAGIAAAQFVYLLFYERSNKQQRKRIVELERQNAILYHRWQESEHTLAAYQELGEQEIVEPEEETWSEIIEDK